MIAHVAFVRLQGFISGAFAVLGGQVADLEKNIEITKKPDLPELYTRPIDIDGLAANFTKKPSIGAGLTLLQRRMAEPFPYKHNITCNFDGCDDHVWHTCERFTDCVLCRGGTEAEATRLWNRKIERDHHRISAADPPTEPQAPAHDPEPQEDAQDKEPQEDIEDMQILNATEFGPDDPHYEDDETVDVSSRDEYIRLIAEGVFRKSCYAYGFELPGSGLSYGSCMHMRPDGCLHDDGSRQSHFKKLSCKRMVCRKCFGAAIQYASLQACKRIYAMMLLLISDIFSIHKKSIYNHFVVSLSEKHREEYKTPEGRRRIDARILCDLRRLGFKGGLMVVHPWRFTKGLKSNYPSFHLHFIVAGYIDHDVYRENARKDVPIGPLFKSPIQDAYIRSGSMEKSTVEIARERVPIGPLGLDVLGCLHELGKHEKNASGRLPARPLSEQNTQADPYRPGDVYRSLNTFSDNRTLFSTVSYLLSHAGIPVKGQTIRYWGAAATCKFGTKSVLSNERDVLLDLLRDHDRLRVVDVGGTGKGLAAGRKPVEFQRKLVEVRLQQVETDADSIFGADLRTLHMSDALTMRPVEYSEYLLSGRLFGAVLLDNPATAKSTGGVGLLDPQAPTQGPEPQAKPEMHTCHNALVLRFKYRSDYLEPEPTGDQWDLVTSSKEKYRYVHRVLYADPTLEPLCPACYLHSRTILPKSGLMDRAFDPELPNGWVETQDAEDWAYWDPREMHVNMGLPYCKWFELAIYWDDKAPEMSPEFYDMPQEHQWGLWALQVQSYARIAVKQLRSNPSIGGNYPYKETMDVAARYLRRVGLPNVTSSKWKSDLVQGVAAACEDIENIPERTGWIPAY